MLGTTPHLLGTPPAYARPYPCTTPRRPGDCRTRRDLQQEGLGGGVVGQVQHTILVDRALLDTVLGGFTPQGWGAQWGHGIRHGRLNRGGEERE